MIDLTKPVRVVDPEYRAWIRTLDCIFCVLDGIKLRSGSVCCHAHAGGMGTKCSDRRTFPACFWHHAEYDYELGRIEMLARYPTLDLELAMDNLNEKYEMEQLEDKEIF